MTASTMKIPACLAALLVAAIAVFATVALAAGDDFAAGDEPATDDARPVELGAVDWGRDFDAAASQARKAGKPLLVLFQEVPG